MNTKAKNTIISLARAESEKEVCGFIISAPPEVLIHPCVNVSRDEDGIERTFEINPNEYVLASGKGKVCGLYHSHPHGPPAFSETDLIVAKEMELPSYLFTVDSNAWMVYIPETYTVSLTGSDFTWGIADCYELIRIYYRQKLNVYLADYDRDENFRSASPDAITKHISCEGFIDLGSDISVAREHDVLLFDTPGHRFPHHLGVYVGGNRLLHHPYGGLSRIDDLTGHLLVRLLGVLRYGKGPLIEAP